MRNLTILCILICSLVNRSFSQGSKAKLKASFKQRVITSNLKDPWEIIYGPDGYLWITESKAYSVSRINIADGKKTEILNLNSEKNFGDKPWPQGGLMGMALHPQLLSGKPFVYLAFVNKFIQSEPNYGGNFFQTKIVRYTWNPKRGMLYDPIVISDSIPGSNDHNGGRLIIARADGRDYLFYSVGDMGAGQFDNGGRANHAQDIRYYEGKILRFNAEPDQDQDSVKKWIPGSNPFENAVWSLGHRNPQGLASAIINGSSKLYSSEHGPYSDDEINLIEKGANYGHPFIIGYRDGNYDGLAASVSDHDSLPGKWNTTYPLIESEAKNAKRIGSSYRDPLKAFNPNHSKFLNELFNATITKANKPDWPSEAPSSLAIYTFDAIPGWKNSLLIPTLKGGKLLRMKLDNDGRKLSGKEEEYFNSDNRYRDIAISPDGKTIYLITDQSAETSGPTKEDPQGSSQKGAVIEFTYDGM
ncbi:PQQ-dependent sugar dehydrogenase [Desertivirga xinjiangensis]|uniref:PQQ-dependent sugar dehydrogenase n=1 Tax=Desertivirga xinjiangensis TaxID=539206 RepID=UPI0021096896|nr:PQQ-dependent sugar dehydrogenase [Pedobacter xinjiangensis]